ncbi:hypothetical protein ACWEKT_16425 [Nocardia takedensis]|nr:hypothetical protein [Nocardia takedensis]
MIDDSQRGDDSTDDRPVIWPDPSPLSGWWEKVMGMDARPTPRSEAA